MSQKHPLGMASKRTSVKRRRVDIDASFFQSSFDKIRSLSRSASHKSRESALGKKADPVLFIFGGVALPRSLRLFELDRDVDIWRAKEEPIADAGFDAHHPAQVAHLGTLGLVSPRVLVRNMEATKLRMEDLDTLKPTIKRTTFAKLPLYHKPIIPKNDQAAVFGNPDIKNHVKTIVSQETNNPQSGLRVIGKYLGTTADGVVSSVLSSPHKDYTPKNRHRRHFWKRYKSKRIRIIIPQKAAMRGELRRPFEPRRV